MLPLAVFSRHWHLDAGFAASDLLNEAMTIVFAPTDDTN
jgi:hypothetical protein